MDILPILSTLRRHKTTAALVILEIALTCAIVCNAVFLIGQRLDRIHLSSGIVENELVQITMSGIGKPKDAHARALEDIAALRSIPGVESAVLVNQIPFGNASWNSSIKLTAEQKVGTASATQYFGDGVIETFGLQLIAGRKFDPGEYTWFDEDRAAKPGASPNVVIITETLAKRLFPGESALGKEIWSGTDAVRVVGVVKSLVRPSIFDYKAAEYSMIYPLRMTMDMGASYILRTKPGDRDRVIAAGVAKLKELDSRRIVTNKRPFEDVRNEFFAGERAMTGLLVAVCFALLLITALGIVGLGSFWVAQRRRQIGVRRALGARKTDILRYFQTENFLLATIGIGIGMALAYGINLFLMVHYELPRLPAIYFPVGAVSLWLLGQAAVLGPALRAASVPPVVATRG